MTLIPGRCQVLSMRNLFLCLGSAAMAELVSKLREIPEPAGYDGFGAPLYDHEAPA